MTPKSKSGKKGKQPRKNRDPLKPAPQKTALDDSTDTETPEEITWFEFDKHPKGDSYRKEIHRLVHAHQVVPKELAGNGWEAKIKVWFKQSSYLFSGLNSALFFKYHNTSRLG